MPRPLWPLMAVVALLTGCGSGRPISYRTQDRQVYDDMCTQGHNVWRMMYTGTDSAWHYFHVNDMDRWTWVRIPADQLVMAEPVRAGVTDDTLKGYWVDPCRGFIRSDPWVRPTGQPKP